MTKIIKNKVVIDTCIWIDYFRNKNITVANEVEHLLEEDKILITGMIELEILQGLRPKEASTVKKILNELHYVECERADFILAGENLSRLRQKGLHIPASDALIAAQCIRRNLFLFTCDKDFDYLTELNRYHPLH